MHNKIYQMVLGTNLVKEYHISNNEENRKITNKLIHQLVINKREWFKDYFVDYDIEQNKISIQIYQQSILSEIKHFLFEELI